MSISEAFENSDLVIVGVIKSKSTIILWNDTSSAREKYEQDNDKRHYKDYDSYKMQKFSHTSVHHYSIEIIKSFKGESNNQNVIVETSSGNCEFPFSVGHTYLIYGRFSDKELSNVYWTDKCTRTGVYSEISEDIKYLDIKK